MYSATDVIWVLIAAILVFFMQAGFALCEAGLTRAKNTGNILMKNMMDFCIGTPCYWLIGFGIMFAGSGPLIGGLDPLIQGSYDFGTLPTWCYAIFQTVFCATAATIVSGSMAERTNFKAYCIYSAAISLIVYPISGHWIWGGGWLSSLNFHDFAGSTCVHMVGGLIACLGAAMLGPRIGKYDKKGKARAIPGHNLTAMALGVFILWFCWFGFNGGSTVAMTADADMELASLVMFNTNLAAAVATVVAMIFTWIRYGKPDVSMTFNAALAGLVAITAPCDCVTPVGAFFIGLVAGFLVVLSVEFFDNVAKIDDPVGAVSVHMVNGMWGTLAVGLFSNGGDGVAPGLFYGGGFTQLGVQALGIVSVAAYVLIVMFIVFKVIDKTVGLRVPAQIEIDGLDMHEHGLASAYSGFAINDMTGMDMDVNENTDLGEDDYEKASKAQVDAAVKVVNKKTIVDGVYDTGMHKVSIICRLSKFDALKTSLNELGVTGITMTQVMGCGIQKGAGEKYRGVELDANLIPKVKVEVVVSKIPVDSVIEAAKKALYTGHIGDGKIFVYNVTKVVKVRTGEEDFAALQDVE
ncbi:adenylate cyclase [Lachnoclostridium sp. An298]|nr:adenylate cyclase [Lachnoclostridium sp. An298]